VCGVFVVKTKNINILIIKSILFLKYSNKSTQEMQKVWQTRIYFSLNKKEVQLPVKRVSFRYNSQQSAHF